jgi:hypothetical protein
MIGRGPSVPDFAVNDDPQFSYFNYFTEIEEHFQKARGSGLFLLSPLDWALIEAWKAAGIPLEAVLRGIDEAFAKWQARPARSKIHKVNSLAYCSQAIAAEAQALVEGRAGKKANRPEVPFSLDEVREYIVRNAQAVRAAGFEEIAGSLESIDCAGIYPDLEQLEQRVTAIEDKLIAHLKASASEEMLFAARRDLDQELKPYRSKMSAGQIVLLEKQFMERKLLAGAALPRLSLFYLGA